MCMNDPQKDKIRDDIVSETVIKALKERAEDNRISCAAARALADELQVSVKEVGAAANYLGIKIKHCELGCF